MKVAGLEFQVLERQGFGLVILGTTDGRLNYLDDVFADAQRSEAFFKLVDEHGLVVARNLQIESDGYRRVRGKRSRGRMSQGELFHHDGCSTPVKPRVVEIRCPYQPIVRSMGTSVAVFPDVVETMLGLLPERLQRQGELKELWDERAWHPLQGKLNGILRSLDAEDARSFFHAVDAATVSYAEPWTLGESRFIANDNQGRTAQHRRACPTPWVWGVANGGLVKRWPAEELTWD